MHRSYFFHRSSRGSATLAKPGLFCAILAVLVLGYGIKTLFDAHGKTTPISASLEEFQRSNPTSGWYTITGATADLIGAAYFEDNGEVVSVYAPLLNVATGAKTGVYVELTDAKTLSMYNEMANARKTGGDGAARDYAQTHSDLFKQQRTFSGLVSIGVHDAQGELSRLGAGTERAPVIEDGWQPGIPRGIACTILGALGAMVCLRLRTQARKQAE